MYFAVLAQFAGVVVVMLTALAFGVRIGSLNTLLASFLCLFSIFSFVVLGIRAFQYFDPVSLISYLNRHLWRCIQSVTPSGYQWSDESLQAHHQRQAEDLLNSYSNLVMVAAQKENFYGKGLVELGQGLLTVLSYYSQQKPRIPSASQWFKRSHKHKDWLLASSNEVSIALATGTGLHPEQTPDLMWVEKRLSRILQEIVCQLGERKDLNGTAALAASLANSMKLLESQFAVTEGLHMLQTLAPHFREQVTEKTIAADEEGVMDCLVISEWFSCALLDLLIGLALKFETLGPSTLGKFIQSIDWGRQSSIFSCERLPRRLKTIPAV